MTCLAVINSFRRPQNIPAVIAALRSQSVPPTHIALVDNGSREFSAEFCAADVDTYIRVEKTNVGPCSRFIAPLMLCQFEFTLFCVDDHLPQERHLEQLLETADELDDWATLGMQGRRALGSTLSKRRIFAPEVPVPCDVVVTSELCRTSDIPAALVFRSDLLRENPNVSLFEDDMILCMGIQRARKVPSYVATAPEGTRWDGKRLPAPHALCGRPNHRELRDEFVRTALKVGWQHNSV